MNNSIPIGAVQKEKAAMQESEMKNHPDVAIDDFPWTIIESPRKSFYKQNRATMRVLSMAQGGWSYEGPQICCKDRWKHTAFFYVLEPVQMGLYIAKSLNDHFHYQVAKKDSWIIHGIKKHCKDSKSASKFVLVREGENFKDDNILVVHNPSQPIRDFIMQCNDSEMIEELISVGTFDENRGNVKIDTGYASAMCQRRDSTSAFVSRPDKLSRTDEPMFVKTMVEVSCLVDMLCNEHGLPKFYHVDGIDHEWARRIHPDNLLQQARYSLAMSNACFAPHMDTQNDARELMSPVPVVHRIVETRIGLARYARIGYSRKSCYDAGIRTNLLQPVVEKVCRWYKSIPETRRVVSNDLFTLGLSPNLYGTVVFPVHCHKTVGLSPFIDKRLPFLTTL